MQSFSCASTISGSVQAAGGAGGRDAATGAAAGAVLRTGVLPGWDSAQPFSVSVTHQTIHLRYRQLAELAAGLPPGTPLLVLGCDLVYYPAGMPDLLWTLAELLRKRQRHGSQQRHDGQQSHDSQQRDDSQQRHDSQQRTVDQQSGGGGSWAMMTFTPRLANWMQVGGVIC